MSKIIKLTTEGDCEGRSTQTVGYFQGTIEQIITYCVLNNIEPYYNFKQSFIDVVDCSNIEPKVVVTEDQYRRINYKTTEDVQKQVEINKALSKLSDKEKELLGLK